MSIDKNSNDAPNITNSDEFQNKSTEPFAGDKGIVIDQDGRPVEDSEHSTHSDESYHTFSSETGGFKVFGSFFHKSFHSGNGGRGYEGYARGNPEALLKEMRFKGIGDSKFTKLMRWILFTWPQSKLRSLGVPAFFGWLTSLGFQPRNHIILAFIGMVMMYRHLDSHLNAKAGLNTSIKSVFLAGYCYGFGLYLGGLYWIVYALHIDWLAFAALIPLTLILIPGILALGPGCIFILTAQFHKCSFRTSLTTALIYAMLWSLWDFGRGHILTGFPWLTMSELWLGGDIIIQSVSLFGSYGLGLVTMVLVALLYGMIFREQQQRRALLIAFFALGSGLLFYGKWHLSTHLPDTFPEFDIVIVQPNIAQVDKWHPDKLSDNVRRLVALSNSATLQPMAAERVKPKLYIWPEAAVPYEVLSGTKVAQFITQMLGPNDVLLTGYNRSSQGADHQDNQYFNSLVALNHQGEILGTYDKSHLVPFGEYVPFRNLMPGFVDSLAPGTGDFTKGTGLKTMTIDKFPPFSPLICYEAIFPGEVTDPNHRPQWLLNITNDGWYLGASGIYQHLHLTRMRAIEEGMSLVRVNYRGVSAVFDSRGREVARIPFDNADGQIVSLPKPDENQPLYSLYRNFVYLGMLGALLLVILILSLCHKSRGYEKL